MFDHVTVRVSRRQDSERFYDTVLPTLGVEKTASGDEDAEWDEFSLAQESATMPRTRNLHAAFTARSRELARKGRGRGRGIGRPRTRKAARTASRRARKTTCRVDAFWRAGIQAGYRDDGAPGERPQYSPTTTAASCPTSTA